MSSLQSILEFNEQFVEQREYEQFRTTKYPDKKLVVLTCMDTRLTELLPKAMNIRNGDAKIIKNAGAIISHPFGSIMRSIIIAIYELKAEEVCIVGHHGCGMSGLEPGNILSLAKENGISMELIDAINYAGINIEKWLTGFKSVEESVANSVALVKKHPLLPPGTLVHGLVMCPVTGKLDVVVNGND